jgi:hypothetical protein
MIFTVKADYDLSVELNVDKFTTIAGIKKIMRQQLSEKKIIQDCIEYKGNPIAETTVLDSLSIPNGAELMYTFMDEDSSRLKITFTPGYEVIPLSSKSETRTSDRCSVFGLPSIVSITAPKNIDETSRPCVDMVIAVDKSGSMHTIMSLVKQTLHFLVSQLGSKDRLSIVEFGSEANVILKLDYMTSSGRDQANRSIENIDTDGSTALCDGLVMAINTLQNKEKRDAHSKNTVISSVLLFTDGEANVGAVKNGEIKSIISHEMRTRNRAEKSSAEDMLKSSAEDMLKSSAEDMLKSSATEDKLKSSAEDKLKSSVADDFNIYTFGFGNDHNATLLRDISVVGKGMYSYIENEDMISGSLVNCVAGLMSVMAKNIQIMIEAAEDVVFVDTSVSQPQMTYIDNHTIQIKISDIQSEEKKDFLIEMKIFQPDFGSNEVPPVTVLNLFQADIKYYNVLSQGTDTKITNATTFCQDDNSSTLFQEKHPASRITELKLNLEVNKTMNRLLFISSVKEAKELASHGDIKQGRIVIKKAIDTITSSASGKDAYCALLIQDLQAISDSFKDVITFNSVGINLLTASSQSHQYQRSSAPSANPNDITNTPSSLSSAYTTPQSRKMQSRASVVRSQTGSSSTISSVKNVSASVFPLRRNMHSLGERKNTFDRNGSPIPIEEHSLSRTPLATSFMAETDDEKLATSPRPEQKSDDQKISLADSLQLPTIRSQIQRQIDTLPPTSKRTKRTLFI